VIVMGANRALLGVLVGLVQASHGLASNAVCVHPPRRACLRASPLTATAKPAPENPAAATLVLALVPLAWGTYGPAIKSLYSLDAPPPELLYNVINYVVSATGLVAVSLARRPLAGSSLPPRSTTAKELADTDEQPEEPTALLAGAELGAYLFLGSTLQIFGLRYTSAGRAAFIVQLTTVMVPILDGWLAGRLPEARSLGACVLAFAGVLLLTSGDSTAMGALATDTLQGDGLVALAAVAYSLHVVRLSYHAPRLQPVLLARSKEISRLAYALVFLVIGVAFSTQQADALGAFVDSFTSAPAAAYTALAIIAWNGVVTTAFPTWAQSYGQARVSAGTAQVIYTMQPLWSSLFGFLLLGETLSPRGGAGGALILLAVLLAGSREAGAADPSVDVAAGAPRPVDALEVETSQEV